MDLGCSVCPDVRVSLIFIVRAMGPGRKAQVELAVLRGKVRKCLQDNWIWKMDCSISSFLYCQYRKDSMQGGWTWSSICFCRLGFVLRSFPFPPEIDMVPSNLCCTIYNQFSIWRISENFSHDYWKILLEVPISWHQSWAPPSQPTESKFRCFWKIANCQ